MRVRIVLPSLMVALLIPFAEGQATTSAAPTSQQGKEAAASKPTSDTIEFKDSKYRFTFRLPASWKGFTIVRGEWGGVTESHFVSSKPVLDASGPTITFRHPRWTKDTPRQDIPIMIFTVAQWKEVEDGVVSVSAAPMPPSELDRNRKYVFALPARYNYASPEGWEEVQKIMEGQPLSTF